MTRWELKRAIERRIRPGNLTPQHQAALELHRAADSPWPGFETCDLDALPICHLFGHSPSGRLRHPPELGLRLFGRCDRCGVGYITDGSD